MKRNTVLKLSAVATVACATLLSSCATQKKTSVAYYEDLTPNRPVFTSTDAPSKNAATETTVRKVPPSHNINKKIDVILDSIDRINLTKKYIDGFTIQVYSGQKREEAINVKQRMTSEVGDLASSLQYIQPKFRVTVGSYITRIEAQSDLVRLKKYFTSAILVPEKILLK